MHTIRIRKKIDSETLYIPELKPLLGKMVEITVLEQAGSSPATEEAWQAFFASEGIDPIDPEIYKKYRDFNRQHNLPPNL